MRRTIFILLLASLCALASASVSIQHDAPVVERKTFDPAHPPKEMPHLNEGEDAVTMSDFQFKTKVDSEVISRKAGAEGTEVVIGVRGLTIITGLHIVIYLPIGANEKLSAHEEGHRKLVEKIYADVGHGAAREASSSVAGHRFSGTGVDWRAAAQNAIDAPMHAMGLRYLDLTAKRSAVVNEIYDGLTAHGVNSKREDDAMAEALAKYEADHPTTRPARRGKGANQ